MKEDTYFDLPELLDALGTHLPQGTLYRCIQVSKTWHAAFIPHLWRTFAEDPSKHPNWCSALSSAIQNQINDPQRLDWYKDVYRRHAKYIRHLTIVTPTMLDACLEGAFDQLRSELCLENVSAGFSGITTTELASAAVAAATGTGGSLMTNLETLDLSLFKCPMDYYFPIREAGGSFLLVNNFGFFSRSGPTGFGTSLFGANTNNSTSLFGANTNNFTGDNDSNTTGNATTNATTVTTAASAPPPLPDTEKAFVKACQRLVLNNPRLCTLYSLYSTKILQGLEGGGAVLRSLKNLSCVVTDGLILGGLPPSVTHLKLHNFGFQLDSYSTASGGTGTTALVHEGLESLEVAYIKSEAHLKELLTQAPSLKSLSINWFMCYNRFGGFGDPFAPTAPIPLENSWPVSQITVLKCRQSRDAFSVASRFDDFLVCFPLLVEYHDDVWSPAAGAQLVKHCSLVEVIRINHDASGYFTFGVPPKPQPRLKGLPVNDSVSILLSGLSRLRVLDIPYKAIKAETILETPWVCLDLEEFRCQIAEVPFLTGEEEQQVQETRQREAEGIVSDQEYIRTDEEDALIAHSERCVYTRVAIMAQLSKLTSLKVLSLSPDFKNGNDLVENQINATRLYKSERDGRSYIRYDDALPDTLYIGLNYGLDQLASLTKLEYLSFESMDHRMDTADIEWFANHLPRLKEMRGLVMENYVGVEPDPKNDALVAMIRRLRPDVAQKQSFGGYFSNCQT